MIEPASVGLSAPPPSLNGLKVEKLGWLGKPTAIESEFDVIPSDKFAPNPAFAGITAASAETIPRLTKATARRVFFMILNIWFCQTLPDAVLQSKSKIHFVGTADNLRSFSGHSIQFNHVS